MVVIPITMKLVGMGVSKGKEIVNNYKYNSYISDSNIPYDGVRKASKYLKDIGADRVSRKVSLELFNVKTMTVEKAGKTEYAIRFYDINYETNTKLPTPNGQYLFETFTPNINREGLALPPSWNQMTGIKQWQIKPGTIVLKGIADSQQLEGAQYIYPGGAEQIFIYQPWKYRTLLEP
ncbi:hypothetical protein IX293_002322 [Fusobacterium necrophorum]|nr:hypothetical protein [Fusobacterium necrophorum]